MTKSSLSLSHFYYHTRCSELHGEATDWNGSVKQAKADQEAQSASDLQKQEGKAPVHHGLREILGPCIRHL